jgi:hypothetical protein
VLSGVTIGARRGQRDTLCIDIRVRDGFCEGGGGFPTFMVAHACDGVVANSLDISGAVASRWRVSVCASSVVRRLTSWSLGKRHVGERRGPRGSRAGSGGRASGGWDGKSREKKIGRCEGWGVRGKGASTLRLAWRQKEPNHSQHRGGCRSEVRTYPNVVLLQALGAARLCLRR